MLDDLQRRLRDLERNQVRLRVGVITDDSPLSVTLGGADIPFTDCKRLASFATPAVADTVAVLVAGNTLIILGKIV